MTTHSLTRKSAMLSGRRSSSIRLSGFVSPKWPPGSRPRGSFTFMPHDLRSKDIHVSRKHRWPSSLPPRPLNGSAATLYKYLAAPAISRDRWLRNSIATNVCCKSMKAPTKHLAVWPALTACRNLLLPLHSRPPGIIHVRAVFNYLAVFEGQNRTERRLPLIALVGIEQRRFNHHDVTGG